MTQLLHCRAAELWGIEDPYEAWCADEAIAYVIARLRNGDALAIPKTSDNRALLKQLGVK
jgi:hypothetical protein